MGLSAHNGDKQFEWPKNRGLESFRISLILIMEGLMSLHYYIIKMSRKF